MTGNVLVVQLAFELHNDFPGFGFGLGEEVLGVLDEQGVDVDDVALDQQVIGAPSQLHQGAGDDVDEAPGKFPKGRAVALAGELAGDARGHLRDAPEAPHRIVAGGNIRPTEMEHVELAVTPSTLGFHVHALEQVGIALGVEHDHDLVLGVDLAADILGDAQLGQPGLANPCSAEHQGMTDSLAQWQGNVRLLGLDAVQARQPAHRGQWTNRIQGVIPCGHSGKAGKWEWRKFQPLLQLADKPVDRRRFDIAAKLGAVGLHQPMRMALIPAKSPADEQPLLAHRYVPAGHHITGGAADVASVTQNHPGVPVANGGKGHKAQGRSQPQQGT